MPQVRCRDGIDGLSHSTVHVHSRVYGILCILAFSHTPVSLTAANILFKSELIEESQRKDLPFT
jgi:hypothetical protein